MPKEAAADSVVFVKGDREGFILAKFYFTNDSSQAGYYCHPYTTDRFDDEDNSVNNLFRTYFNGHQEVEYQKKRWDKDCHIDDDFIPNTVTMPDTMEYHADFITLSPDLVRYLKSSEEYSISAEDEFFDNPYLPYSNIKGGYGIFGAYTVNRTQGILLKKDL
ncbi:MAG: DUF4249 family protein [Salinivirgaceae bacterium]|nr:DUF4249 family protein [Salinivirgaceae bacterium]MBR4621475.1 DUF4249 family protein [Salinivirgaceae bacterium]MBR6081312.1 DUF4249 family protein [Salinivirgaceae bacterium]